MNVALSGPSCHGCTLAELVSYDDAQRERTESATVIAALAMDARPVTDAMDPFNQARSGATWNLRYPVTSPGPCRVPVLSPRPATLRLDGAQSWQLRLPRSFPTKLLCSLCLSGRTAHISVLVRCSSTTLNVLCGRRRRRITIPINVWQLKWSHQRNTLVRANSTTSSPRPLMIALAR